MPAGSTKKEEREYEHIKDSYKRRGRSEKAAKEIAARTVNKERRLKGETSNKKTQGTGNPNKPYEDRKKDELVNLAKKRGIKGYSSMKKDELARKLKKAS